MMQLQIYPTGRPCWIDPFKVSAILDTMEMREQQLAGAPPKMVVVGTTIVCDGVSIQVAGPAVEVATMILDKQNTPTASFLSMTPN